MICTKHLQVSNKSHQIHDLQKSHTDHHNLNTNRICISDKPATTDKIIRRTTETYITDVGDDHYTVKRARQKRALDRGHFTECWEPYRPLGDLVLEPYELVWGTLEKSLPKNVFISPSLD